MLDVVDAPGKDPLSPAAASAAAAGIRPCAAEDIPAVARLFRKTFAKGLKQGTRSLEDQLRRELFEHPWRDSNMPSLVFAGADGVLIGFIAIRPLRLLFNGDPVTAAVSGTLMVDEPAKHPLVGARLLRSYLNGPQDLSLSESANALSQPMWSKLGGRTEPAYSMEWLRVIEPAGLGIAIARERSRGATLLRPFAAAVDWCAARVARNPLRVDPTLETGVDADDDDLVGAVLELLPAYRFRPAWDRDTLLWFLDQASLKERYGPLIRRVVRDRKGQTVGAYLYCGRPRGIALVLQIFAAEKAAESVVDDLVANAYRRGAVAVRGRVQPELADVLLRRHAVFVHSSSLVVRSKRPDILAAIHAGDAMITGFACESWSGLIGGLFV
jgi:hypothetical protein